MNVVLFLAFAAVAVNASPMLSDVDRHHCKPTVPVLATLDSVKFAGKWYVDSSDQDEWLEGTCHEFQYAWHAHKFHYKNVNYTGYYTTNLREITADEKVCFEVCSYSSHGYMHGSVRQTIYSDCFFNASAESVQVHRPCYPRYDHGWNVWVLKTDYINYSLVWLCTGGDPYVLLQARSKKPLSAAVRKAAQIYLQKNGFEQNLWPGNNTSC